MPSFLSAYIFLEEIQKVEEIQNPYLPNPDAKITFVDTVLGFMKLPNADIYITGSNSKMLSSDIVTEFRDRGDEVRIYPLSFSEFYSAYKGDKSKAWREYYTYGGMPLAVTKKTPAEKSKYLKDLFNGTYIKDVLERHKVINDSSDLEELLNVISSSIGSLTNPLNLSNTFKMENIIFNELKIRGFDVDVGVVEHNRKDARGKSQRNYLEVDFIANMGSKRFYIQSALNIDDQEKRNSIYRN